MGLIMGKAMDENLKKNQAFMLETQTLMLQRQIQMQNLMRERQMAMQLARAREMFNWWASFYGLAGLGMIVGFAKKRNPAVLAPLLPLTFVVGYQYDLALGNKMQRIKAEADNVLEKEMSMLDLPGGIPTLAQIEDRRKAGSS